MGFAAPQKFIQSTLDQAREHAWDGYAVDMESFGSLNWSELTRFVLEWGQALHNAGKELSVWIGGPTRYDLQELSNSPYIQRVMTMNTYTGSVSSFKNVGKSLLE